MCTAAFYGTGGRVRYHSISSSLSRYQLSIHSLHPFSWPPTRREPPAYNLHCGVSPSGTLYICGSSVAKAGSFLMSSGNLIPYSSKNSDFIPIGNRCEGIRSPCSHLWYNSRSRKKVLAQVEHDTFQFWWLKVNNLIDEVNCALVI